MTDIIRLPGSDYPLIKSKSKTLIFRTPALRLNVNVADWVTIVFSGSEDNVLVDIMDIGYLRFKDVNREHARLAGYNTLDELKKALINRYPSLENGSMLYYYKFELMGVSEKVGE